MSYYADQGFEGIAPEALAERPASPAIQRFIVDGYGPVSVSGIPQIGRIVLAHGAGAGHLSDFMRQFAATLSSQGLQVWAIDFPYMQQMSELGKRRPPPPVKKTLAHFAAWYDLITPLSKSLLWVGGKSMGGRVASLFASERRCGGVVAAGTLDAVPTPRLGRLLVASSLSALAFLLGGCTCCACCTCSC